MMKWDSAKQTERLTKAAHEIEKESQQEEAGGDPTVRFFGAFLVAHVLIWTILAALTQPNLPAETLELLTDGQLPAWGYYNHPPLAVWLMSFVSAIFAPAAWPAYLLAQLCIATCMWAAWKIGKEFLHPWTAICGAIVLEGCYFFTIGSTAFTSAHLAGALWALAILALYHGFQLEQRRYWVIVGVCLGLGMLSHYSTALLFVAMLAFSLLNRQARQCWDTSWPFLAGGIGTLIVLPHVWWVSTHGFSTMSTALHSWNSILSHGKFTFQFVVFELLAVIPIVLLLIPVIAYFRLDEPTDPEDEERDFVRQYLLVVTLLPAALMLAFALVVGVDLGSAGLTLWTFAGVAILMWSDLDESRIAWRKVILHSGAVGGGFAALLVVMNFMMPYVVNSGSPSDIHFPGRELAKEVRTLWKARHGDKHLEIVAGPDRLAQNASWYHRAFHHPLAYNNLDENQSVGVNDTKFVKEGGIILWMDQGTEAENRIFTVENLTSRYQYANIEFLETPIILPWGKSSKNKPIQVHVAIIHPAVEEVAEEAYLEAPEVSASNVDQLFQPVSYTVGDNQYTLE